MTLSPSFDLSCVNAFLVMLDHFGHAVWWDYTVLCSMEAEAECCSETLKKYHYRPKYC